MVVTIESKVVSVLENASQRAAKGKINLFTKVLKKS